MVVMADSYYLINIATGGGGAGLTYASGQALEPGRLAVVPLRQRRVTGVVRREVPKPRFATKPVERVIESRPLPAPLLELADWMSAYYACDIGSVWQTMLPTGAQRQRRTQSAEDETVAAPATLKLTPAQQVAVATIEAAAQTTCLLDGITGSGKTEVYIALAQARLARGQSVIVLVPEIALTPQIEERFQRYFGDRVIINHSRLTESQRHQIWQRALEATEPLVVIGPRSTLFTPLARIGLIAIDECHETSYKQENAPRYETVMVAAKLAHLHGAKLVLGSATPGLREAYLARAGRLGLAHLPERFNELVPVRPSIVDLRDRHVLDRSRYLSEPLIEALGESLEGGRQSLLFLNRRGSASSQLCGHCGHVALCPTCQLALTFHADELKLICHICNFRTSPPAVCPNCQRAELSFIGSGTKRIETEVKAIFPEARVARLDRDNLSLDYLGDLFAKLRAREIDILVGTQMIAKGLDLPTMDTVGVVLADSSLYLPDFSAAERTFDLLSQVSGRVGRGDRPGQVIIQTYSPDHPAIEAATSGDYWGFAAAELAERRLLGYPPYVYLLKLTYSHADEAKAQRVAEDLRQRLAGRPELTLAGPAPSFRAHAGGRHHWQLIAKAERRQHLVAAAATVPAGWTIDLDPINLL